MHSGNSPVRTEPEANVAVSVDELKARARRGDAEALRELRARGFFETGTRKASYALSDAQRRLWLLDQITPGSATYNVPGALRLRGTLDVAAFQRALGAIQQRHEALRTSIAVVDGEARQIVHHDCRLDFLERDLSIEPDPIAAARAMAAEVASAPFRLAEAPLFRTRLLRLGPRDHVFVSNVHHIVCDAWSLDLLWRELLSRYDALARGDDRDLLPPPRLQYKDFTAWQLARLARGEVDASRRYWHERFGGELPVIDLPADAPRPAVQTFEGDTIAAPIATPTLQGLLRLAETRRASLFMTLLAAARVLLWRYTGQREAIIGTPIAGRVHPDVEDVVGFFVNMLPLRGAVDPDAPFVDLLDQVRQTTGDAHAHQEYPFDRLVESLDVRRDLSRSPLFDVLFTVEEERPVQPAGLDLRIEPFELGVSVAKYDLTFLCSHAPDSLHLAVTYNRQLFARERIAHLVEHFGHLLADIVARPDAPVRELTLASPAERGRIRDELAVHPTSYPADSSLGEIVETHVRRTPDADAVVCLDEARGRVCLSYRELNRRADAFARALRARGLRAEEGVGVLLERSERVAVVLLGILKAGGCYVPLDPVAPRRRHEYVLNDAACRFVVIDARVREQLGLGDDEPLGSAIWIDPDDAGEQALETGDDACRATGRHLALVIYTSGSTGQPKGTLIEQRSVSRLVLGAHYFQLTAADRVLQLGSFAFDASIFEIWGPLLNGGCLCFATAADLLQPAALRAAIAEARVTALLITPALFNLLTESDEPVFERLRCVMTGGETMSVAHANRARQRYPGLRLLNAYGPTENTTYTTTYAVEQPQAGDVPVGSPVSNTSVYVLDDDGRLCPIGVAGEILTGGDGLARGYVRRPDLTAERFVPDPFHAGERLYRTGDIGRWRWDGALEFLGRRDAQVKIRGYRVEPGEIEQRLAAHSAISQAVVVAPLGEDGTRQLAAYYVASADLGVNEVRDHLAAALPTYMMPSHLVRLDRLPLTTSGKVDRGALPAVDLAAARRQPYERPRTEIECTLAAIWQDVLQVAEVSRHDHFFELGGQSLNATRVLGRVQRELDAQATLRDIFVHPTLEALANELARRRRTAHAAIPRAPDADDYPASHAQRRLWLLGTISGDTGAYNVPGALLIEGRLDPAVLSRAFSDVVARHESLRTVLPERDGELRQRVLPPRAIDIPVIDLQTSRDPNGEARRLAAAEAARPFVLAEPPLFRLALFQLAPARHVFFFVLHHIVTDGWSMRVMLNELVARYRARLAGDTRVPTPLTLQYRDYAVWQRDFLATNAAAAQRRFWIDQFAGEVPALELPTDAPRPSMQQFEGDVVHAALDRDTVQRLRRLGRDQSATFYMVLLTLMRTLLYRWTAQADFVIGTPVSARDHADLDAQVGFFVNMLALRDRVPRGSTFAALLARTRDRVAEALNHQAYPFDLLVEELALRKDAARSALFDVAMSLEEAVDGAPSDDDLSDDALRVSTFDLPSSFSKFDLMFAFAVDPRGGCAIALEYSTALFARGRIERLAGHLQQVIARVLADPSAAIEAIDLLPAAERAHLDAFAGTVSTSFRGETIARAFERQAARTPDAPAVLSDDRVLTYAELNQHANAVAHALRARGIGEETAVGVLVDRTERVVVALLGILKAGGCYVPLDPVYPRARLEWMTADAGCRLVIGDATVLDPLGVRSGEPFGGVACLALQELKAGGLEAEGLDGDGRTNPSPVGSGDHLAYVMYTSGSTGDPKGTAIEQRSVLRLVLETDYLRLTDADCVLQAASLAFDASTLEIWGPLLNGGRVCFAPSAEILQPDRLAVRIARHGVTTMWLTAGLFNQLVESDEPVFGRLRCVLTGGEKLSAAHVSRARHRDPHLHLLNGYGPTENTTFTTTYPIADADCLGADIPIGYPIANTTVYVLDDWGGLCPIGVPGEICTGGEGLARGYINRPDATAERFVPHPFEPGARVYRTGDVGRWRADGALEFVGRRDAQVKIRGFRVEPGEVEARLHAHPSVRQAAVIVRGTTAGRRLAAFVAGDEGISAATLQQHLASVLPPYMLPSEIVLLPALPLNANGKIDRGALDALKGAAVRETHDAPRTEAERVLAEVWASVLDRPRVSRDDQYFESGGDSIRAIQIVNRLRKAGWTLDLRALFQHPVLRDAAAHLRGGAGTRGREHAIGVVPLSPIQRWFFTQGGDLSHFNQSILLRGRAPLDADVLRQAIAALVTHHDALRLVVRLDGSGVPIALAEGDIDPASCVAVRELTADDWPSAMRLDMDDVQRGFDLTRGPLFKAVLYRPAAEPSSARGAREAGERLLLVAHHVIIDAVSWRVLLDDLEHAYAAIAAGQPPVLTPQADSYAAWAASLDHLARSRDWTREHAWWTEALMSDGDLVSWDVPPRDAPPEVTSGTYGECASVERTFSAALSQYLIGPAHAAYHTGINDLLLAALARALQARHGHRAAWIGLEGHGRDLLADRDVNGTVGWFTSLHPYRLPCDAADVRTRIRAVKESLRESGRHALSYGALRWLTSPSALDRDPDCQIGFNYLGQIDRVGGPDVGSTTADAAGVFAILDEHSGTPVAPTVARGHELEMGGVFRDGQLTLSLTYNPMRHDEETASDLLDAMGEALEEICTHCREQTGEGERTPSDHTYCPLSLDAYDGLLRAHGWQARDVEDVYPLSPMQEGMLFQSLLDPASRAYVVQLTYRLVGALDLDRFRAAWREVAARHGVIRASLVHEQVDRPLQVILRDREPELHVEDLADAETDARARRIADWQGADIARGFDLQRDALMRIAVFRESPDRHRVVWSYHHAVLDGWSLGVLYRDLLRSYLAAGTTPGGGAATRPATREPAPPFAAYARWLLEQDTAAARAYWREYLRDGGGLSSVPRLATTDAPSRPAEVAIEVDAETTAMLVAAAAAAGATLNTMIQALWAIVLSDVSQVEEVEFGAVVSGRPPDLPGIEEMVGLFINTVPVRARVTATATFAELVRRLQQAALESERFHFYPLADIQSVSGSRRELFDHVLVFENYPMDREIAAATDGDRAAFRAEAVEAHDRTHYDLDLTIAPGETLAIRLAYRTPPYTDDQMRAIARHLERLVRDVARRPSIAIGDLPALARSAETRTLTEDETQAILRLGTGPVAAYPVERTLHDLFEETARRCPTAVAVRHHGEELSYAALDARANRIAQALIARDVHPGDFVAILDRRGIDVLASMLGVLKTGAAFLPIDPEYPANLVARMLADSGASVVISRQPWLPLLDASSPSPSSSHPRVLRLDDDTLAAFPAEPPPAAGGARDVAYLLFTSGSTGAPKGAMVRHDGAINHIYAEFDLLRFHPGTAFLQSAPSSSDISVWQFLAPVLIGGRTVIADHDVVCDPARLHRVIVDERITLIELVPVALKALLDHLASSAPEDRAMPALEWAMVTGEAAPVVLVNQWLALCPSIPIVNAYGPTEAADDISQCVITQPLGPGARGVPIGTALPNLRLYVVDPQVRLVPHGEIGEICVSGIGVGAGYWRDEARTRAAFVSNPWANGPYDTVLYRTGDLGRWRPSGDLECLDRLDQQVKVRGYRIEPGEVESCLLTHPEVAQAVVAARRVGGEVSLVAWIVGDAPAPALREHARQRLPEHMVPAFFVRLERLPQLANGKIERRGLPTPEPADAEAAHPFEAPVMPLEVRLASLWTDVLQVPRVGRRDGFFELGGHSLKAMQVVSRLHRDLGVRVSLQQFFANPTIAELARVVQAQEAADFSHIVPAAAQPDYELSHAQKRLWLQHQLEGRVAYNMPEALLIDDAVDLPALRQAFATLVQRHEALRTAFVVLDGEPRQRILDRIELAIDEVDLADAAEPIEEARTRAAIEAARPFDLTQPPLVRVVLYRLAPRRAVFLMVMHHIIGDGWSMTVLYRELLALYDAYRHGRPNPLPPLTIQYKDFAAWQNQRGFEREERFWLAALGRDGAQGIALPYDQAPDDRRDFAGSMEESRLDAETTARLRALATAHGTTLSNVVLTVFEVLLYQWTRQRDLCVGLSIANRTHPSLENLLGFFVNILPIRVEVSSDMEFTDLLHAVRVRTTEAFEHQDYPFDRLVQRVNPARIGNRQPLVNIVYAFQNYEDVAIDLGTSLAPRVMPEPAPSTMTRFPIAFETSKFDLTLFVTDLGDELLLTLEYDTHLFRRATIRRCLDAMTRVARMAG